MVSYRQDPYLWVHLAGLAALPLLLDICLLGLATGTPWLPVWAEMGVLVGVGVVPVVWMQWQRPFYIFSLLILAIRPTQLSEERRQMLPYFRSFPVKVLTAIAPVFLIWVLWQLYYLAPIASDITPFAQYGRPVGLLVAAIAFLASNLFLQVPLSVLRVLLVGKQRLAQTEPIAPEEIPNRFTTFGLPINQILPEIMAAPSQSPSVSLADSTEAVVTEDSAVEQSTADRETVVEDAIVEQPATDSSRTAAVEDSGIEQAAIDSNETVAEDFAVEQPVPETATPPAVSMTDTASLTDVDGDLVLTDEAGVHPEPDAAEPDKPEIEQTADGANPLEAAVDVNALDSPGNADGVGGESIRQDSAPGSSEGNDAPDLPTTDTPPETELPVTPERGGEMSLPEISERSEEEMPTLETRPETPPIVDEFHGA